MPDQSCSLPKEFWPSTLDKYHLFAEKSWLIPTHSQRNSGKYPWIGLLPKEFWPLSPALAVKFNKYCLHVKKSWLIPICSGNNSVEHPWSGLFSKEFWPISPASAPKIDFYCLLVQKSWLIPIHSHRNSLEPPRTAKEFRTLSLILRTCTEILTNSDPIP